MANSDKNGNKSHKDKDDYEVGYQKPPKSTQFSKGHSGNPNGRPKGTKNWATVLNAALEQTVTVLVNGSSKQVTKLEAATTQLANKATQGDLHSIRLLLQLMPGMNAILSKTGMSALSNEQDRQTLSVLLQRMSQSGTEVIGEEKSNQKEGS